MWAWFFNVSPPPVVHFNIKITNLWRVPISNLNILHIWIYYSLITNEYTNIFDFVLPLPKLYFIVNGWVEHHRAINIIFVILCKQWWLLCGESLMVDRVTSSPPLPQPLIKHNPHCSIMRRVGGREGVTLVSICLLHCNWVANLCKLEIKWKRNQHWSKVKDEEISLSSLWFYSHLE